AVISLLPVYHRVYDAGLLLLPLGWALLARRPVTARHRRLALWLLVPFLLPGVSILERLEDTGFVFAGVTKSWWWQALVIPHQVWTLLALAIVLLFGLRAVNAMPNAYRNLD